MEFNKSIIDRIFPILSKHKYRIVDEVENFIKFQSEMLTIAISYDFREDARMLSIGRTEERMFFLDGNLIQKFFIPQLEQVLIVPEVTQEDFIQNLITFFEGRGKSLISGDAEILWEVERYVKQSAEDYTKNIMHTQNLKEADKAWELKDYAGFINVLGKMNLVELPKSWQLKYKMAQEKL
jgi:hypothetical protein